MEFHVHEKNVQLNIFFILPKISIDLYFLFLLSLPKNMRLGVQLITREMCELCESSHRSLYVAQKKNRYIVANT